MKRLLIIRHGQSEWNALGLWQGQADPPLSALGERQAEEAADALADFDLDEIVSSTLIRARRTAETIASRLGLARPTLEPLLIERNAGDWSGLSRAEIDEQYPGFIESDRRPPGYESDEDLLPRILEGVAAVLEREGPTIGVLAHGGVIYTLEEHFGEPFERIANLGARWVHAEPDGQLKLGERVELLADATIPDQI